MQCTSVLSLCFHARFSAHSDRLLLLSLLSHFSHLPDSYLDLYMLTQCLIVAHHFSWPLAHFMSSQLSHLLITASDSLLFVEFAKTDSVDQHSQHFEHSLQ